MTTIQYISQLGAAASVAAADILPISQGSTGPLTGTTRKVTVAQLFTSPTFTGTITLPALTVTGAATVGTTLAVTGASTLAAVAATTLTTSGATTLASVAVPGAVTGAGFTAFAASPPPVGNATPNSGAFTTLAGSVTATGSTTSRTLANRFADTVNVNDFGAVGNGVTDDTAAIQAAVLSGANKIIYFPKGNYPVSAQIVLGNSQLIVGSGQDNTVFNAIGSGFDVFNITSNGASITNLSFVSATARSSGAYINLSAATRSNRIADVKMLNGHKGVYISGGAVITIIENIEILNATPATGMAIHIQGGNDTFISKLVTDNPTASQPAYGILIQSSEATWVTDCDMIRSGIGLMIAPQSAGEMITWCFFNQVACDSATYGIVVSPAAGRSVRGLTFVNCWGATNTVNGVNIGGAGTTDGVQFIGGRFVNNGQSGAGIASANPINVDFINCIVSGNSQTPPNLYSGFDISGGVNKFRIMGCISGQALGFGATQNRGILINAGTSTSYVIKDNVLTGNTTAMIDNGTGSAVVSNNIGYVTQASGTSSVPIGQTVASITHGLAVTPNIQDINATMTSSPPVSGVTTIWITAVTSSTFQIATNAVVAGANLAVAWQVRSRGS